MRIAVLDKDKCHPDKCGLPCIRYCPGVKLGKETIVMGEKHPIISEELCSGCGICVRKCPYKAIHIENLPEEFGNPLHQYGPNGFRLYGVPVIKEGVIGIIGQNGIGKSTLVKILSGTLIPNFGKGEASKKEVLERFRGTELHDFFKKAYDGEIKLAYKPQEVDKIPMYFKGKVSELLEKSDERGVLDELKERFGLEKIWNKQLNEISGGELQKIAIAAVMCKDADVYFFDEPSSFLDIKQRMLIAREIRNLNKTTYVVEHDLAVLDYLSDYIIILYGIKGVYGKISSIKNARVGINEYIDGFLKSENVRIRAKPISFEEQPVGKEWKSKERISYPGFTVEFPGFKLDAESGEFIKGEIIGILGENGIGKTTFLETLSKKMDLKVAYKPQYIHTDFEGTVREFIESQEIDKEFFLNETKIFIEDIMDKKVNALSGGELQRLFIVLTISKKADICLLDEPSAFLDIEQRLVLNQKIRRLSEKREITTLVVDHDIIFIDAIANRLMVFEGEPGKHGKAGTPGDKEEKMNQFLKLLDITFRRDPDTKRPRINKPGSQKDIEQKKERRYYYA